MALQRAMRFIRSDPTVRGTIEGQHQGRAVEWLEKQPVSSLETTVERLSELQSARSTALDGIL